jgi:3-oxoadipate enol-lactonase
VGGIDFRESNRRIACPALIIAGSRDEATPPAMSEDMQAQIPGAQLVSLEAAHLSAVEMPGEFAELVRGFVADLK